MPQQKYQASKADGYIQLKNIRISLILVVPVYIFSISWFLSGAVSKNQTFFMNPPTWNIFLPILFLNHIKFIASLIVSIRYLPQNETVKLGKHPVSVHLRQIFIRTEKYMTVRKKWSKEDFVDIILVHVNSSLTENQCYHKKEISDSRS